MKLFYRFKFFIKFIVTIDSFLPRRVNQFLFVLSRSITGKIGRLTRYVLIKNLAERCGENVSISEGAYIYKPERLSLGDNVSIHPMCYIDATGGIKIGNNVSIAHSTTILSTDHTYSDEVIPIKYNPVKEKETIISDDVWISCGVRILRGTIIHSRSIVAAGAVVTNDVPSRHIVGGVPARILKKI